MPWLAIVASGCRCANFKGVTARLILFSHLMRPDGEGRRTLAALARIALPQVQAIFAVRLVSYAVGLDWERWRGCIDGKVVLWGVVAVVAPCVRGGFGQNVQSKG